MIPLIAGLSELTPIGRGGSAHVYAATRDAVGDRVAVKVLNDALTDAATQRHFEKEAESLRQLADVPGVVAVLASGVTAEGDPYLVMPLFDGGSSQSLVSEEKPLAWHEAARLVAAAADAVDAAHQRGIWHRDLKPGNILLTSTGRPFVADFGIAKLLADAHTTTGASSFTPRYAAPEVLNGQHTAQSDVYSLGATFVAFVTGQAPFADSSGSVVAIVNEVLNSPPPDLSQIGVPHPVAALITRTLAKDPHERPASPGHLAALLREQLGQATTVAHNPSPITIHTPTTPPVVQEPAAPPAPAAPVITPAPISAPVSTPAATAPASAAPQPASVSAGPPRSGRQPTAGSKNRSRIVLLVAALLLPLGGLAAAWAGGLFDSGSDPAETAVSVDEPSAEQLDQTATESETGTTSDVESDRTSAAPEPLVPPILDDGPEPASDSASDSAARTIRLEVDGSGDATSLVDALTQARDGDTVELGAGNHTTEKLLRIERSVTLRGQGPDTTSITVTGDATALDLRGADIAVSDLSVRTSYVLEDDEEAFALVQIVGATDLVIRNIESSNALHYGLASFGFSTGTVFTSTFNDNATGGLIISQQSDINLIGNTATGNGESGYVWFEQATGFVVGNRSDNNERSGFAIEDQARPTFIGNTADSNAADGFTWLDQAAGTARVNVATNNAFDGFAGEDLSSPTWALNVAEDNNRDQFHEGTEATVTVQSGTAIRVEVDGSGDAADLAAAVAAISPGDIIELGEGKHRLSESVRIPAGSVLIGQGMGQTVINMDAAGPALVLSDDAIVFGITLTRQIEDSAPLVSIAGASQVAVLNSELMGGPGPVLEIRSTSSGLVAGSALTSSGAVAAVLDDASDVRLAGNQLTPAVSLASATALRDDPSVLRVDPSGNGDHATLAEALTNAATWSVIELAAGQHVIDQTVIIRDNVHVRGVDADRTELLVTGDFIGLDVAADGARVSDLTLRGTGANQDGVVGRELLHVRATDVLVDNVTFTDSPGYGMAAQTGATGTVTSSDVTDSSGGIALVGTASLDLINNRVARNITVGIAYFNQSQGRAIGNEVEGNGGSGFVMTDSASPTLISNRSDRNGVNGFLWALEGAGQALQNTASNNGLGGFVADHDSAPVWAGVEGDNNPLGRTWASAKSQVVEDESLLVNVLPDGFGDVEDLTAALAAVPRNGVIFLNPGEYVLDSSQILDRPVTILGSGTGSTTITGPAATSAMEIRDQVTIHRLTINGPLDTPTPRLAVDSGQLVLLNVDVAGGSGPAVRVETGARALAIETSLTSQGNVSLDVASGADATTITG